MANLCGLLILCLVLVVSIAGATQYNVGGSKGWTVPNDPKEYNQWAEKRRFRVGDSLVFSYLPDMDSVLLVDENSYHSCNTSSFIDSFNDGNTVFVFSRSGPYYFISGNKDSCLKNESLLIVVMADRSNGSNLAPSPSSSSSPPPPPRSIEFKPTSSPPPPPNAASLKMVSLMTFVGSALIGSLFAF